ncbi:HD domain-containing protein [Peptoniphilus sp. KCTC 25270]|uniref:HD domain-containing protein n=1 Tax=Peptoniphilus sp. KCTC 25270 TaxID=2897414 RepID=UPI001E424B3E|nr:HD domain-containing protein [Peptoniphilus sp. KCTC 25270]MCD1146971.1 HD domain-containing protein [Peptoniphilus sp. KCTC 25270]
MDLQKTINFITKLDEMKNIYRRTSLIGSKRKENDAEHTFHIASMAYLLKEYAPEGCDIHRVIIMLLFHDVVEIEAGDTFAYDLEGDKDKFQREMEAANHLFGILPNEMEEEVKSLWLEFEKQETIDSQFALTMDRLQPILLNACNGGGTWKEEKVPKEKVYARVEFMKDVTEELYEFVRNLIEEHHKW